METELEYFQILLSMEQVNVQSRLMYRVFNVALCEFSHLLCYDYTLYGCSYILLHTRRIRIHIFFKIRKFLKH